MAEAIMNGELSKRGNFDARAESCGVMAYEGASANENAKQAVSKYGYGLDFHSARRIKSEIVLGSTVFCMDKSLTDCVRAAFPNADVYDLCTYAGVGGAISDPYGMGQDAYDRCAEKIRSCILKILDFEAQ